MRPPHRLAALGCAALVVSALLLSEATAQRFSMSYLYFGTPTAYVERVERTRGSLDEISPNYFNLNTDGT